MTVNITLEDYYSIIYTCFDKAIKKLFPSKKLNVYISERTNAYVQIDITDFENGRELLEYAKKGILDELTAEVHNCIFNTLRQRIDDIDTLHDMLDTIFISYVDPLDVYVNNRILLQKVTFNVTVPPVKFKEVK